MLLKVKREIFLNILIIMLFLMLSYLFVFQLLQTGMIKNGDDAWFQINRILEIRESIKVGNPMPYLFTHSFGKIAYPLGIFYPEVTLIPIALLSLIFENSVTGIYVGISMYTFLTLCVMYFILRKINMGKTASVVGAILYAFSAYRTVDAFTRFAMGEFLAMTFVPLFFYGLYSILKENYMEWPYLSLGYIAIVLSHVLSAFIMLLILLVLMLTIFFTDNKVKKMAYLVYSGIASVLGSLIFLIPFLEQEIYQKYSKPDPIDLFSTAQPFGDMFISALNNSVDKNNMGASYSIGLPLLVVFFIGIIYYNKLNKEGKFIYIFGSIFLLCSSKLFPWFILQDTPISVIQYPFRLLVVPTFCFSVIGTILVNDFLNNGSINRMVPILTICIMIIFLWMSSMKILLVNEKFNDKVLSYTNVSGFFEGTDTIDQYTPLQSHKNLERIAQHIATVDDKDIRVDAIGIPNEQKYESVHFKKGTYVELPVSFYKNYQVYQNGKKLSIDRSTENSLRVKLKNNSKELVVKYKYSYLDILSYITSMLVCISLLILVIYNELKNGANCKIEQWRENIL